MKKFTKVLVASVVLLGGNEVHLTDGNFTVKKGEK